MFGLGIRYLNGWAMAAADGSKKEHAEWPPHPDRVFMAFAAAWFETGQDAAEGAALRWLEALSPPGISASDATFREVVNVHVPVNDTATPFEDEKKGKQATPVGSYPLGRPRRDRRFPVAIPYDPVVHLVWSDDLPETYREPLATLCRKVSSVGHSASLVQIWMEDVPPAPTLVPLPGVAKHRLRVTGAGRLDYLEARCNRIVVVQFRDLVARQDELKAQRSEQDTGRRKAIRGRKGAERKTAEAFYKEKFALLDAELQSIAAELKGFGGEEPLSFRPEPGLWQGYDVPPPPERAQVPGSIFDPRLVVLKLSGKRLSLPSTLKLIEALRGALLNGRSEPMPEWLSGHALDGTRSVKPHVALLPLPFVGSEHADGRLMGVALALPRELDPIDAANVLEPWLRDENGLARRIRLFDGQWLECAAELDTRESRPWSLRAETWMGPARRWASVTPVVLDRHFDGPDKWEKAAQSVKDACVRVRLPRPVDVLLHPVSLFEGVPRSNEFPWLARKKDGGRMHHAHAVIVFGEDVLGPVLVGAGRFRGYGLCRPLIPPGRDGNV